MPEIRKFMTLSTCHLPENLIDTITHYTGVQAFETDAGAFLWVPDNPSDSLFEEFGIPLEILTVQLFARKHGCDYVLFDCDGPEEAELPKWEW